MQNFIILKKSITFKFFFAAFLTLCNFGVIPLPLTIADTIGPPPKIVSISFTGNKATREKILRMFLQSLGLDTGAVYDSATVGLAKQKLRATNLFSKVEIVPVTRENGVHLQVIIKEVFYVIPDGFGAERYTRRYGHPSVWYRLRLGLTKYNFCGNMETFQFSSSLWDERSLSLSWTKPLYPSPYYIGVSAATFYSPDLNFPQNRFAVNGRITIGRKISLHSRGFAGIIPTYTRIDNSLDNSPLQKYREVVSFIGCGIDFRNDTYDAARGWSFYEDFRNNLLYSKDTPKYGQFFTEIRAYSPGFFKRDRFAFRLQSMLRTNDAGNYKRLYLGGEGSVRGFPSGWLGILDTMNNTAAICAEYRFFILRTTLFDFTFLSDRFQELRDLFYELEGAIIFDAGHLWHDFQHPFDRRQNGAGIGAGVKIKVPPLRSTGCIDAVWPITKELRSDSPYHNRTVMYSIPEWHFYLSFF
jgi:outer membrane protein assembly factor BamA